MVVGGDSTEIQRFPVIKLGEGELVGTFVVLVTSFDGVVWRQVDENGAGDAYVGGFIAGLSSGSMSVRSKAFLFSKRTSCVGWDLKKSFAAASYCAWVVIRRHGCSLPNKKEKKGLFRFFVVGCIFKILCRL